MKKIFFLAIFATLLAAGCQKTEVINQVIPDGEPSMSFTTNMGKLTKAAEDAGTVNLSNQDFRLWAYYVEEDPNRGAEANTIYDSMGNISVSDDNDEKEWGTTVAHFWPGKDKALRFFAVSADSDTYGAEGKVKGLDAEDPNGDPEADTKVTIVPDTKTLTITDFVVDHENPDVDLMIADYEEAHQDSYKGTEFEKAAKLNFRHTLAKVEFNFVNTMALEGETDPNEVIVQHMYVTDIVTKGTVSVTGLSDKLTSDNWTPSAADEDKERFNGDYTKEATVTLPTGIEPAANLTQYDGTVPQGQQMVLTKQPKTYTTWLVIPQPVGTSAEESLNVVIAYLIGKRQFVATFPLYRDTATSWGPNQYIKYNVSLSPNMIGFSTTVVDWETTPSNGVDINN